MSTPIRKKLERQRKHELEKKIRENDNLLKINKSKKETTLYAKQNPNYRETPNYPSVTTNGPISTVKQESIKYTGDYITGIATMHKSNLVPVSKGIDPRDYATMRRNWGNLKMSNIIQFPQKEEIDVELNITKDIMKIVINEISQYGYNVIPNDELFNDIGVVFNIFYAILVRNAGQYHAWHPIIDEMILFMKDGEDL